MEILKIYFGCNIGDGMREEDRQIYSKLIEHLENYGKVLSKHFLDRDFLEREKEQGFTPSQIHDNDMALLTYSDVFVAELTAPSLGLGYEIRAGAVEQSKPSLFLYRDSVSKMIEGIKGSELIDDASNVVIKKYADLDEAFSHIDRFFGPLLSSQVFGPDQTG
jgi:hypothetical protein